MPGVASRPTAIPGLLFFDLTVHGDQRGWFKENWQRAKMLREGLPDFGPVQQNVTFNAAAGSTRGLHAEPWDKLVSLGSGRVFGAWVDLRPGPGFGAVVTAEVAPDKAIFIPRGVANGYQALEDGTLYTYLVNEHWSPEAVSRYSYVNLADPALGIGWPIPLERCELSAADRSHPPLSAARPVPPRATVVLGGTGQLGRALAAVLPEARCVGRDVLDLADAASIAAFDWTGVGTVINAAAHTDVDGAETGEGRARCWAVNVTGVAGLVEQARTHRFKLVHVSSDYVFDGTREVHPEDEPANPLGVYGATKAAGDALVATLPAHLIVRTSWVVGEGRNFVATMARLADTGVSPSVVEDQRGRLTFAADLAAGIAHLLAVEAPSGVYNLTNSGPTRSWADLARRVFELRGRNPADVTPVTTAQWAADRSLARRPGNSTLDLGRIEATGFHPADADQSLVRYLAGR